MFVINSEDIKKRGVDILTEVKFENSISRATAVANPRQIERAINGLKFGMDIIYEVMPDKVDEIIDDIKVLADGMKMLEYDYLGGNGSRGYGKVKFSDMKADVVVGKVDESIMQQVNEVLADI